VRNTSHGFVQSQIRRQNTKTSANRGSGSKQNPLVPVFWGIVVILFGLWIVISFIIPDSYLPPGLQDFSFWGLIILIIAIAVILTGFRIIAKR